ncbi:hypothetical protein GPECTOR_37g206 [Gonium pectorale]|uniref:Uncharacterized protein n=1 Tax=Gonium pectorale TaxID=33097 RepID=A0A150GCY2_GONPE|nr:hypothetical protein GPECTOR_37g206 [Gonium pectorale]|eukprot:KXZ47200.1 hypothetical protein GPECTOR_37g206 [Gonium pectorale]
MSFGLAEDTASRQVSAAAELADWLAGGHGSRTLADCTSDDVLVYMAGWYTTMHRGRKAADGSLSPKGVEGRLSLLSGFFVRAGRHGRYNPATGSGNRCETVRVMDYKRGYARLAMEGGYVEHPAVPLLADKYRQLLHHLWACVRDA